MIRRILVVTLGLTAVGAHASGHFDVDDAGMLDPGQCQYELWMNRVPRENATLWHLGPACRVGPIELGLSIDDLAVNGRHTQLVGPQVKWTFFGSAPVAPLAAALALSAVFASQGGHAGGQAVVPVTWQAADTLRVSLNVGLDWLPGSGDSTVRSGINGDWALNHIVSLIAERNKSFGLWTSRIGARFSLAPMISIDVSAAQTGPARVRSFVIGLNHEFGR